MADVEDVPMKATPATTEAPASNSKKRPRVDLGAMEPRKKGRSIFGQAFGTLKRAQVESVTDAAKKRKEIDSRIMGKITQDQSIYRKQDEARRDRITAQRKEEDLAIKDGFMRFRHEVIPRLANFLLTSDLFPVHDENARPDASRSPSPAPAADRQPERLAHPPPTRQPAPLYYLPAILTPTQAKFLERRKAKTVQAISEERKEWRADKVKGVTEVVELRKKAEEALSLAEAEQPALIPSGRERSVSVAVTNPGDKMEVEEKVGEPQTPTTEQPTPAAPVENDEDDAVEY